MRQALYLFSFFLLSVAYSQTTPLSIPRNYATGETANWTKPISKVAVDTCGPYFNNYVGLVKTTLIYFEELRTGNALDFNPYGGRAQRYHANQPIEISGLQFYSFHTNLSVDSLMVVTLLFDYDEVADSIGVELARDTVWVSHTTFSPLLPEIEVNSYFDEPVLVTEDYIVALYTSTNDSLKIITNSAPDGDGGGEGISFAYYNNPVAPIYTGWYATLPVFGPIYDLDYLINALVSYPLHNDFSLSEDSICPNEVSAACVTYDQVPNFSDPHYNRFHATPLGKILWTWDDGFQNADLEFLCHTYTNSGTYTVTLTDSIRRHDFADFTCAVELSKEIFVRDSVVLSASGSSDGLTGSFIGTVALADSVSWDFGDGNLEGNILVTEHTYGEVGTYEVWFYAYGPCNVDSVMITVTVDDVGINETQNSILIFPNPANESFIIKGIELGSKVEIVNMLGEVVHQELVSNNQMMVATNYLSEGAYLVRVTNQLNQTIHKLAIQH